MADDLESRFAARASAAKAPPPAADDLEKRFAARSQAASQPTNKAPYQTGAAARQAAEQARTPPQPAQRKFTGTEGGVSGFVGRMADTGIGMAKGATHDVLGLADATYKATGAAALEKKVAPKLADIRAKERSSVDEKLKPSGWSQEVGYGAEQVGKYFVPIPGISAIKAAPTAGVLARAAYGAVRTGLDVGVKSAAETGSPTEGIKAGATAGAVGGVTEAAIPGMGKLLKKWAYSQYGKVLHPLGNKAKEVAEEHMPEIIDKGYKAAVGATKEGLANKFTSKSEELGAKLQQEYTRLDPIVKTRLAPIYNDLSQWIDKNAFTKAGTVKDPAIFEEGIKKMQYIQDALGPYIGSAKPSVVQEVRQALDKYVYSNGLTADESVQAASMVRRQTANSIRKELNSQHPSIANLNNEYHLQRSLAELMQRNVKSEIGKLQFARNTGIIGRFLMGAAVGGGEAHREGIGPWGTASAAALGGLAMESTAWRTVSAVNKAKIADLLVSGNGVGASNLAARLTGVAARKGPPTPQLSTDTPPGGPDARK